MIFRPVTHEMVKRALKASATEVDIEKIRAGIARRAKAPRAAWEGGEAALEFLIRKQGEPWDKWENRRRRFRNVPIVRPICDTYAALIYATPPERSVYGNERPQAAAEVAQWYLDQLRAGASVLQEREEDEIAESLGEWMLYQYEANGFNADARGGLSRAMRDGFIGCKVWPYLPDPRDPESFRWMRIAFADKAEDIFPILDPDDAGAVIAVMEARRNGSETVYRQWVAGAPGQAASFVTVNSGGEVIGPRVEWWTQSVPFVFLNGGAMDLESAVQAQRALINLASYTGNVLQAQGHAQLVSKGRIARDEGGETTDARPPVKVGEMNILELEDDNGDVFYVSPNAPLMDHLAIYQAMYAEVMRVYNMPSDFWRDSGVAEKPLAKRLSWTPTLLHAAPIVEAAKVFERSLGYLLLEYAATFREEINGAAENWDIPAFDWSTVTFSVRFGDNPLPTDRGEDEAADAQRVDAGLLSPIQFWYRRPEYKDADPEVVARAVFNAEQESTKRNTRAVETPGVQPPPFPGEAEEPEGL